MLWRKHWLFAAFLVPVLHHCKSDNSKSDVSNTVVGSNDTAAPAQPQTPLSIPTAHAPAGITIDEIPLHPLENPEAGITPITRAKETELIGSVLGMISSQVTTARDAHPKAHGCVEGATFTVDKDLDLSFRQGFFATPGQSYDAIVRLSSGSTNPQADDRSPSTQGFAVKMLLPEALATKVADIPTEHFDLPKKYYKTFDIITISRVEEFLVNDLTGYFDFFRATGMAQQAVAETMRAGGTPQEAGAKAREIIMTEYIAKTPPVLQPYVGMLFAETNRPGAVNLLRETYSSWVPYAFDTSRAVKYSWQPCQRQSLAEPQPSSPNYLSEQLKAQLSQADGCFELYAQFHEPHMPSVENGALPWGEKAQRIYVKLGRLHMPNRFTTMDFCQSLSFNPGHALPNQRGIGTTQRARRLIYSAIAHQRYVNSRRIP